MSVGGPRDPGLPAERTALAHVRTWLGVLVVALLLARQGGADRAIAVAAGLTAVIGTGVASAARVRRITDGDVGSARWTVLVLVVAIAAMQVAAVVTVL